MSWKFEQAASLLFGVALVVGIAGVWTVFVAWRGGSSGLALCGTVLLLSCPALAVSSTALKHPDGPADGDRLRDIERSLRFTRGARAVALIGSSYAVVLWVCQAGGLIDNERFVIAYSMITFGATALYLPWMSRRERNALGLHASLRQSLDEFKATRNWDVE